MNDQLVVVLPRLLDLEHDQDHLLQPVRKLEPVPTKPKIQGGWFSGESLGVGFGGSVDLPSRGIESKLTGSSS